MRDLLLSLGITAFGLWLLWHCPRAAIRELRTGLAEGVFADYPRDGDPARFWMTISLTFSAGALGLILALFGLALFLSDLVGGK
jgi:hypothetical protein